MSPLVDLMTKSGQIESMGRVKKVASAFELAVRKQKGISASFESERKSHVAEMCSYSI